MSRTLQHRSGESGLTGRYRIDRLVYFESFRYVNNAIARETEIKALAEGKESGFDRGEQSHMGRPGGRLG